MPAVILIIEDNPPNLQLMSYLLRAFGHFVVEARDGAEGCELARTELPDLILCDLQMPALDGYEVLRRIKSQAKHRNTAVVAVTALAMVGDRDKTLAAGFDGYMAKPISPESFIGDVEAFLPPQRRTSDGRRSHCPSSGTPISVNAGISVDTGPVTAGN